MPNKSLSRSGLLTYQKYSSLLAGNDPYIPFTSSYDLLETEILTGSQASVTFSNLNSTYGADYQHLQIRAVMRSNRGSTSSGAGIRFNSDSATNYTRHFLEGTGSSVGSSGIANTDFSDFSTILGSTSSANSFAAAVVDLLDVFETSKYTTVRSLNAAASTFNSINLASGHWRNTDALTDIQIFDRFSTFVSGSRFSLYGLRSA